jgi:pyruvate ferredoxin oxidoreductase alpha subunit
MSKTEVMEVSRAVAEAVKACRPGVIATFPITPQTHIIEYLAEMSANGEMGLCQYIPTESEFTSASIVLGASAAGARAYTASSSQGLLLMTEVLWDMAGLRLPAVLTGANRAISAPISIQADHQDTFSLRDCGVLQMYVENAQESYDAHIQAFKLAEEILLPVMVCIDGWALTHAWEPIELADQTLVDGFLPPYKPVQCLDPAKPIVYGQGFDDRNLIEYRYMMQQAVLGSRQNIEKIASDFKNTFGRFYGGLIEEYRMDDAEICIMGMGSVVGTIKASIDELRQNGVKAGMIKIRFYRPFPDEEIRQAVKKTKCVAVISREVSYGSGSALASDVMASLYNVHQRPLVFGCFAGIGGREINRTTIKEIVAAAQRAIEKGTIDNDYRWFGLKPELIDIGQSNNV